MTILSLASYTVIKIEEAYDIAGRRRSDGYLVISDWHGLGSTDHRGRHKYESSRLVQFRSSSRSDGKSGSCSPSLAQSRLMGFG